MARKPYTYRAGRKLELEKEPDELVARVLPETARAELGAREVEQVSSHSTRVHVEPAELEEAMRRMRRIAPTHHAYVRADTGAEFLISDRVLVTFRDDPAPGVLDRFLADYALVLKDRFSERDFLFQLTDHTGMNPVKLVVKLMEEDDRVENAENDLNQRMDRESPVALPTDPHYLRQWFLHRRHEHPQFDPRSSTRCEEAWQALGSMGTREVVVGVTDDGCRLDHPDFAAPGKFAGWGYFRGTRLVVDTDVDALPEEMYVPGENHGTSCAAIAAGEANAVLSVGAAPGCRLLPIRWETAGGYLLTSDSKLLRALAHLATRADVVSSSWGRVPSSVWAGMVVTRIRELARTGGRRGRGILFLWAAGNENCPIQHVGTVDVPYTDGWRQRPDGSWVWIGPQRARRFENNLVGVPGVAHVAALASTAQRSHYSNHGTGIVLCAPSSNSHAFYRAVVPGLGVTTATGEPSGVTHGFGGTSSATPLVAGIAALVISAHPGLSAEELLSLLKRTASRDLNAAGYPRTPPAAFDPDTSWDVSPVAPFDRPDFQDVEDPDGRWSPWFGFGRVDARAAVAEAMRLAAGGTPVAPPVLEYRARPRAVIPDNDAGRARDVIHVPEDGRLRGLRVEVDIRHDRIGDLLVRLIGPEGTTATLHRRGGGVASDLQRSYTPDRIAGLRHFLGRSIRGDWTLEVGDRQKGKKGTLEGWALRLEPEPGPVRVVDVAGVEIPDANPAGILRTVEIPSGPPVRKLTVSIEISHPWASDLVLTLTPPGRHPFALPLGPRHPNGVNRSWSSEELSALAAFRGLDVGGRWTLRVADVARLDVGRLTRWSVEVMG
jgi:subtilisin-like proprotein convertase family protein